MNSHIVIFTLIVQLDDSVVLLLILGLLLVNVLQSVNLLNVYIQSVWGWLQHVFRPN
jgi:uncharacterized protein YybS (DUF2232 family)